MENFGSNIKDAPFLSDLKSNAFLRQFFQLCCLNVSNISSKFDGYLLLLCENKFVPGIS